MCGEETEYWNLCKDPLTPGDRLSVVALAVPRQLIIVESNNH